MPSKFGFETDDDRRQQREEEQRHQAADQQLAEALANQYDTFIMEVLIDLANAHQSLGPTQISTGPPSRWRVWSIYPAGFMLSGPTGNDLLRVELSATDDEPVLTVINKAGGKIPKHNIERLCAVLEEHTNIPARAQGLERRVPRPGP